jgi:hypothetical protein
MKRTRDRDFPALREFFGGYLHEDFAAEHGTPEAAWRAFEADARGAERRRVQADAKRLLAIAESEDLDDLRARLAMLGAKWAPRSRAALVNFLSVVAEEGKRDR